MLTKTITVDPGWNTGIADWFGTLVPVTHTISVAKKVKSKERKLTDMWIRFESVLRAAGPRLVICETMELWEGSLVSMASAKRGDLFTLQTLVGGYANLCVQLNIEFKLVKVNEWKGQLSKTSCAAQIKRINGKEYITDHEMDAVGIGLSEMGHIK